MGIAAGILTAIAAVAILRWYIRSPRPARRYKTFWPRFWAGLIDAFVFTPLMLANYFIVTRSSTPVVCASWFVVHQLAYVTYSVVLHGLYGQTAGKKLLGVKVLDASEGPISFRQAALRDSVSIAFTVWGGAIGFDAALRCVDTFENPDPTMVSSAFASISTIWFAVELATMLTNSKRRALHDFIAGTVVARVSEPRTAEMAA